jgi:hypothetical protein
MSADNSYRSGVDGMSPDPSTIESPVELERAIDAKRDRLAATIDELTSRAKPKEIARRGAVGARNRAKAAATTPDGQIRKERLGAVAGALVALGGLMFWLRRRRG